MKCIRLIAFTILVPGVVAGYIPYSLLNDYSQRFEIGILKYLGVILIILGGLFYCWSALSFLLRGGGTPTIWFTKPLKFLLGEEPKKLVSQELYKLSRNPMYIGVLSLVLGIGVLTESVAVCVYGVFLFLLFNAVIIFLEEPHLKKKFGKEYEEYLKRVPRWIGIPEKKNGGTRLC